MSTATNPLDGSPLGAAIVVVALVVSADRLGLRRSRCRTSSTTRPVRDRALRDAAGDRGVLERQPFRVETRVDDRIHLRQVDRS